MSRRLFRIAGRAPKVKWRRNATDDKRTIEEAVAIAQVHDVAMPEDVDFFEADEGELEGSWEDLSEGREMETARGPTVAAHADGYVYWKDHYNRFGKIPVLVHPDVLTSDEAIVGVFEHEVYELFQLRKVFHLSKRRRMSAMDYGAQVTADRAGNFHDRAWEMADKAVRRMRRRKQS